MKSGLLRDHHDLISATQRIFDLILIVAVHVLMTWAYGQWWRREFSSATVVAVLTFSVAAELCSLYRPWRIERIQVEIRTVLVAWLSTVAILTMVAFATKMSVEYSRVVSFGWFALAPVAMCGWRLVLRAVLRVMRANGRNISRVAMLGATASAREVCEQIVDRPWLGIRVQGVYDDRGPERREDLTDCGCQFVGDMSALVKACRAGELDVVYVSLPLRAEPRIAQAMRDLADTTATVYLVADFVKYGVVGSQFSAIGRVPLMSMHDTPFHGMSGALKRLEDIVVGSMILMLIAIPMMVISVLVKVTSPGPVFFRQRRYGLNGKEIRVLKFRSMSVCEDGPKIAQATKGDTRVTPLGRFLRRSSLDELPQFLQVVTGEMSIVGPRPHAVAHNESYRALIPGYMLRHKVKPGITGWAQVNGWRGETPEVGMMKKRVDHDLEYLSRWTVFLDLKIILLTVFGRRKNQNAY